MTKLPDNPSESFKRKNPEFYPAHSYGIRSLETKVSKFDKWGEGQNTELEKGAALLAYRVSLVVLSRRLMDSHDNLPFSLKPLADAIAESLGVDDSKITWEYGQVKTSGQPGVVVKIEAGCLFQKSTGPDCFVPLSSGQSWFRQKPS